MSEGKTKTQIKAEEKALKEEQNQLNKEEFLVKFENMFKKKDIKILKKNSEKTNVFIWIENNKIDSEMDVRNLLLKLSLKYFKTYKKVMNLNFGNTTLDIFNDILIPLKLIEEVEGVNFQPIINKPFFNFEGKNYFNEFQPSKIELELRTEKKKDYNTKDNSILKKEFSFPQIDKIFRHWVGDNRIFYIDSIRLIENLEANEEYKIMFDNKKPHYKEMFGHCDPVNLLIEFKRDLKKLESDSEIIEGYETKLNYFYNWLGYIYQNPCNKIPNGCAFITTQGIGKDFIKDTVLSNLFNPECIKSLSQEILAEKFNGWSYKSRLVIAQELEVSRKSIDMFSRIKDWMTNPKITIRDLFKTPFNAKNYSSWLFFSNHRNSLKLETGDRRFSVFEQRFKIPDLTIHDIHTEHIDLENLPKSFHNEILEFGRYLLNLNVTYTDVKTPLESDIKDSMLEFAKNDIDKFINFCNASFKDVGHMFSYFNDKDNNEEVKKYIHSESDNRTILKTKHKEHISYTILFYFFNQFKQEDNIKGFRDKNNFISYLKSHFNISNEDTPKKHCCSEKISVYHMPLKKIFDFDVIEEEVIDYERLYNEAVIKIKGLER